MGRIIIIIIQVVLFYEMRAEIEEKGMMLKSQVTPFYDKLTFSDYQDFL